MALLPGVQESAEASESGIPFDLHVINCCPSPHLPLPKLAQRAMAKKRGKKHPSFVFPRLGMIGICHPF